MNNIKKYFPYFKKNKNRIYLDTAASALKLERAIKKEVEYLEGFGVNVGRGLYKEAHLTTVAFEDARKTLARFLNAEKEEIVFTSGTTESLNILASSLSKDLIKTDEVLISIFEHNSSYLPWYEASKEKGFKLKTFYLDENHEINYDKLEKELTKNTKYFILSMSSNVLGNLIDIKKVNKICHEKGIKVITDAAQAAPHIKIDVKDMDIDYLAFSGHKLYASSGVGVLYGKQELLKKIKPSKYGGGGLFSFEKDKPIYKEPPYNIEVGTPPIAQVMSLAETVRFIEDLGFSKIEKHENELKLYFQKQIEKIKGIKLINKNPDMPIFSFAVKKVHPHDVASFLAEDKIAVRAGFHCAERIHKKLFFDTGTIRVSFGIYNTKEDIDKLMISLRKTIAFFEKAKGE